MGPQQTPPPQQPTTSGGSGLDTKTASTLSYVLGWITGIIFLMIDKQDPEVRFHAWQSIALFGGLTIVNIAFSIIGAFLPFGIHAIISLLLTLVYLAAFIAWIVLLIQTYQGKRLVLPVVGPFAEQQAAKG